LTGAGMCVVSQSGETKDVHRALQLARNHNIPVFGVVNAVGSLIARDAGVGVYCHAGRENAVASTKAFTCQVVVLALIACWFSSFHTRLHVVHALHRLVPAVRAALRLHDECFALATTLQCTSQLFILGKGYGEPVAYEGALKIKEMSYIHAEGFSGGALKHGPFALLEAGTPVILLILDDEHADSMRIAAEEVKARGAKCIVITDQTELARDVSHHVLLIPSAGVLTALVATIPLQLLAYNLACARDINPDVPRNLATRIDELFASAE